MMLTACGSPNPGGAQGAAFVLETSPAVPRKAPFSISGQLSDPVLARGEAGSWDDTDVLNPSVIRLGDELLNYYSGFDGKVWRTGLATSTDGVHWHKSAKNPILGPGGSWDTQYIAANGSAIRWLGKILYFYQGRDAHGVTRIGLATSTDGAEFTKYEAPVLDIGPNYAWDGKAVGDPYVIAHSGELYLYYLGMDAHDIQRIGVAKSSDGVHWTKLLGNPVMDVGATGAFDENGLGEPSVVFSAPYFYMIYTGRDGSERRDIGYAISGDGVTWRKMSIKGLFGDTHRADWNSQVICDTTILSDKDGRFTVWYGGGDVASPDQGLDGQIGTFALALTPRQASNGFDASYDYAQAGMRSTAVLSGSWDVDGDGAGRSAWVGPSATTTIWSNPVPGRSLVVSGWMPVSIYRKAGISGPISVTVRVNGKRVARESFTDDKTFTLRVDPQTLNKVDGAGAPLHISVETDRHFTPSDFSNSPDNRSLSLKLTRISLSS